MTIGEPAKTLLSESQKERIDTLVGQGIFLRSAKEKLTEKGIPSEIIDMLLEGYITAMMYPVGWEYV